MTTVQSAPATIGRSRHRDDSLVRRDLVQFSFRAPRELRKRANRASIELEVPVQELVSEAVDEFLRARGF